MAKFQNSFKKIYIDPRDKIYLYFCTGICATKVSVGEYN
jgi:hypothetical protein